MDKKELIKNNTIMKKIFSILALLFGLLPCMSLTAYAASVSYVDGNGTSQTVDATELESTTTSWTDGSWYIVPEGGLTISGRIEVSGTLNLILRDGTELTASAGITTTGATLNIYAQSTGTGALTATGANGVPIQAVTQASEASVLEIVQAAVQAAQSIYTVVLLQQPAATVAKAVAVAQASVAVAQAGIAKQTAVQAAQSIYTVVLLQQPAVLAETMVAVAQASAAVEMAILPAAVVKEVRSTSTAVLLRQPAVMVDN